MADSFWKIPQGEDETPDIPLHALKEQAELLTEQTNGLFQGIVTSTTLGNTLWITMAIRVPTLNNYYVEVLEYKHPPAMFPAEFEFNFPPGSARVEAQQQFVELLRDYLSSVKMSKVIGSLLAQAQA